MAGFRPVAPQIIVAVGIVCHVVALVGSFVAGIIGAGNRIVTIGSRSRLTIVGGVAGFRAVAPQIIVAIVIVYQVIALVGSFVAGIVGAGNRVVTVGCRSRLTHVIDADFCTVAEISIIAKRIVQAFLIMAFKGAYVANTIGWVGTRDSALIHGHIIFIDVGTNTGFDGRAVFKEIMGLGRAAIVAQS